MRRTCLVIAASTGLGAALLLGGSPTAHYDGTSTPCSSAIVDTYAPDGVRTPAVVPPRSNTEAYVDYQLAISCDQQEHRWELLGGLGLLVSLLAFTGAQVAREDEATAPVESELTRVQPVRPGS